MTKPHFIPQYDPSEWRVGFEIEMLFGDLGMKRYKKHLEIEGAYDRAPLHYCSSIAKRLSKMTGETWLSAEKASGQGFYVVPEYDLDPINFPTDALGGVELVTPPLVLADAEELRLKLVKCVRDIESGFVEPLDPAAYGWHVNVDKGIDTDGYDIDVPFTIMGLWEGSDPEIEMLLHSYRYQSRYAAPQHHAYGPALINALGKSSLRPESYELDHFLHKHCGRSKRFATNFGKLEQGYVELRHLGLDEFMEIDETIESRFSSIFHAMTIRASNYGQYNDRTFDRFTLLTNWLGSLADDLTMQVGDGGYSAREAQIQFKNQPLARVHWDGTGDLHLLLADNEDERYAAATIDTDLDADELIPGLAVLALDQIYAFRCGMDSELKNPFFEEAIHKLSQQYRDAGLLPSDALCEMDNGTLKQQAHPISKAGE